MESDFFSKSELRLMRARVVLGDSRIHGTGVFAKVYIPRGRVVGYFKGEEFAFISDEHLGVDVTHAYDWAVRGFNTARVIIEGPLRYLNHSKNPNCKVSEKDFDPLWRRRAFVRSIKEIKRGEELTLYYGDHFDKSIRNGGV